MANRAPSPPDAYIFDVLMADLVGHDRAPSAFIVFLKLWHLTGGPGRRAVQASLTTLALETGLSKSAVQAAIRRLKKRGFIEARHASATAIPAYAVHAPWRR